jgi:pyridinium-3,5-biscarboxylic acid mononucleotide sulfurtransferase
MISSRSFGELVLQSPITQVTNLPITQPPWYTTARSKNTYWYKFMNKKFTHLQTTLRKMGRVAVAYSAGIDSTLLLKIAHDTLGENVIGITAVSASLPAAEKEEAAELARQIGARHVFVESHETEDPRYLANPTNRCYFCKINTYGELIAYAQDQGFEYIVDGTNADDVGDHRPGRQAAREHGIRSPLQEVGLTKAEIRELSRELGLPNWNKPAAACLSSRLPYGTLITIETLGQVEQAEAALRKLGFQQLRVRHHDQVARIEVSPVDFDAVLVQRETIVKAIKTAGYNYVTLDLSGFRSGSMNEVLTERDR